MKKSLLALVLAAPLTMGLTGCVVAVGGEDGHNFSVDHEDRAYDNRKKIARLALNSSLRDAQDTLGVADFNETYQLDDKTVKVLYYRTHRLHKDGLTTKDECTYLQFIDGALTETGNGGEYVRAR